VTLGKKEMLHLSFCGKKKRGGRRLKGEEKKFGPQNLKRLFIQKKSYEKNKIKSFYTLKGITERLGGKKKKFEHLHHAGDYYLPTEKEGSKKGTSEGEK